MWSTSSGICSPSDITWFSKLYRINNIRSVFKKIKVKGEKCSHLVKALCHKEKSWSRNSLLPDCHFGVIPKKNQNEESGEGVSLTIDRQHGSAPPTGGGYSVGDIVLVKHSHPPSRGVHIHGWGSVGRGLLWNIRLRVKKKTWILVLHLQNSNHCSNNVIMTFFWLYETGFIPHA